MEVNCTLFVQMGNFAIAYCLLRYLFFKPALNILYTREKALSLAKSKLQQSEDALLSQREHVESAWLKYCIHFKKAIPTHRAALTTPFCNIAPSFNPIAIREQVYTQKQSDLEHVIIKKVSHVRL